MNAARVLLPVGVALGVFVGTAAGQAVAITGGTVVPVRGAPIPGGTVVIEGERIAAVGVGIPVPAGATVIDARGKYVYPGLIDPRTRLGLYEIGSFQGSLDYNEQGEFNPAMATVVALNPHSELIPIARANGVTTVLAAPTGGRVSGVGALIDLDGWTPAEMARVPLAALLVNYPQFERGGGGFGFFGGGGNVSPEEFRRRALRQVEELDQYFAQAKSWATRRAGGATPAGATERQLDAMVPAVTGRMPVIVFADSREQILGALRLADAHGLRLIIGGGDEAWQVADTLAARGVPVLLGPVLSTPGRDQPFDALYAQPAVLAAAGVRFAFSTGDAANVRNVPYHAAMAVAHGLDPATALRAMTAWPAEMLGVGDQIGVLAPGYVANLFVADGDPLDVRTTVEHVLVRGRPVDLETRHTRLYDRFRSRPGR